MTGLLRWAAVGGQLHPWKRGAVLGGLFAVVWTGLLVGFDAAWEWTPEVERIENVNLGPLFNRMRSAGHVGAGVGAAVCGWVLSRSPHDLWRQVSGWLATFLGLVLTVMATGWLLSAGGSREHMLELSPWLVPVAMGQALTALTIPRGARGAEFRALALLAGGLIAFYFVLPPWVAPPLFVDIDEASYPVYLERLFVTSQPGFSSEQMNPMAGVIAATLWSTLWLRHGHRWRGWFGVTNVLLVGGLGAVLTARHLYASSHTYAHADDVVYRVRGGAPESKTAPPESVTLSCVSRASDAYFGGVVGSSVTV